jgi:bifunctional non-homologous end joining protein LigD
MGETAPNRQPGAQLRFVVQKHAARRLHYDFRLEIEGVLKSWAVPRGPSLDPSVKRLAVMVEDHPLDYADFEGVISEGQYGAGVVLIWDRGVWIPKDDPAEAYQRGALEFGLQGERLRGWWALVRMKRAATDRNWLLIKQHDIDARPGSGDAIGERYRTSVVSGRDLEAIAAEEISEVRLRRLRPGYGMDF